MSRTVEAVCTAAVAPGLETTGIPVHVAGNAEQARERIDEIRGRGSAAVVLVESGLHEELEASGRLPTASDPVLLRFPGPIWAERPPAEEYVLELLRRAVGYRVKLR